MDSVVSSQYPFYTSVSKCWGSSIHSTAVVLSSFHMPDILPSFSLVSFLTSPLLSHISHISVHNSFLSPSLFISFVSSLCLYPHPTSLHTPLLTPPTPICLFTNSFIQQIFGEHLPCARHLSLHPSVSSPISLHISFCLPIFPYIFPAHLFPPTHLSFSFSSISLCVGE